MTGPSDEDLDGGDGTGLRGRLEAFIPSVIRRTVHTGDRAKQLTEDAIRAAIGDLKLPKEAVSYLVELADNTKREVVRVAAREFREFLESARFHEELAKLLTQLSFEIRTEIRFIPNDQALRPSVTTSARIKSDDAEAGAAAVEATEGIASALKSSATEVAELLLSRVFRTESGAHPASAAPAQPAETPPKAQPKKRRTRTRGA